MLRNDWVEIVNLLIKAYFLPESKLAWATLYTFHSDARTQPILDTLIFLGPG